MFGETLLCIGGRVILGLLVFAFGLVLIVFRRQVSNNDAIWYNITLGRSWPDPMFRPAISAAVGALLCLSGVAQVFS